MAINLPNSFVHILTICIFLSFVLYQATAEEGGGLADELSTKHKHDDQPKKQMKEVYSKFTVYWHDIVLGSNATSIPIIKAPDNSSAFGLVNMIDDPLTLGPNLSSIVGRAQGLYGVTSQKDEFSLMMVMNFVFTKGSKYDGSTITIMGRNAVLSKVREMAVIGGSGLFRFARGYVRARTKSVNTIVAIVKYDIYVKHYNIST